MKKHLLFIICIACAFTVKAQNYVPTLDTSNVWFYSLNVMPIRLAAPNPNSPSGWNTYDHYTDGEATLMGKTYKKLYQAYPYPNPGSLQGYVREDTALKTIYYLRDTTVPEYKIYDYSMQIGDSIQVPFSFGGTFYPGYYRLDSIRTKVFHSISRRVFYLNKAGSHTLEWIEGIGHFGDFVYPEAYMMNYGGGPFYGYCPDTPHDLSQFLTCFWKNNRHEYFDSCAINVPSMNSCFGFTDSCNYGYWCSGLEELSTLRSARLYPNPGNGLAAVEIQSAGTTTLSIEIVDELGRIVFQQKELKLSGGMNKIPITTASLPKGIYLVKLRTKEEMHTLKYVVN